MGRVHIHSNKLCRSAAGGRVRIDLMKMLVGYTRRLGAQRDYFIEVSCRLPCRKPWWPWSGRSPAASWISGRAMPSHGSCPSPYCSV